MEICRLLERNDGKLFIIKHERYGAARDDAKSNELSNEGSCFDTYGQGFSSFYKRDRPIFKIKIKPRDVCKTHNLTPL